MNKEIVTEWVKYRKEYEVKEFKGEPVFNKSYNKDTLLSWEDVYKAHKSSIDDYASSLGYRDFFNQEDGAIPYKEEMWKAMSGHTIYNSKFGWSDGYDIASDKFSAGWQAAFHYMNSLET